MKGRSLHFPYVAVVFIAITCKVALPYVYDLKPHELFSGDSPNHGSFGYSMDFAKDSQGQMWLIVGAPKGRDDNLGLQSGLLKACQVTLKGGGGKCESRFPNLQKYTDKEDYDDQLFGVAVTTVKTDQGQEVWSCAPKYQREHLKAWSAESVQTYYVMSGHCFAYSNRDQFQTNRRVKLLEQVPLFFGRAGHSTMGYEFGAVFGEAGMSLHFDEATRTKYFGAPGVWNWTGTYALQRYGESSTVMTQPWSPDTPRTNDYAGFDLTTGTFLRTSSSRPRHVAMGAPRAGEKRQGVVFLVETMDNNDVKQVAKVQGVQSGEYFGAALAAADLNGDNIDELIVGSPIYSDPKSSQFEEGRISIYSSKPSNGAKLELVAYINGPSNQVARFGAAIASVGDLDEDGFGDFVVGAPFEEQGVVRIFFGRPDLENLKLMSYKENVIKASDVSGKLRGFGNSFMKSLMDVDGNGLPDLAIGSYLSGHAVVLRRNPSVWVDMHIKPSINEVDIQNLQEFDVTICSLLKTSHADGSIFIEVLVSLEVDSLRTIFKDTGLNNMTKQEVLKANIRSCFTSGKIAFKSDFNPAADERPLEIRAQVEPIKDTDNDLLGNRGVLNNRKPTAFENDLPFTYACPGSDKICYIDLTVSAKLAANFQIPYVIGSSDFITVTFTIENLGQDPAILPVFILYPEKHYINNYPSECELQQSGPQLKCILHGPIQSGKSLSLSINVDVSKLKGGQLTWDLNSFEVYSKSDKTRDTNEANNKGSFQLNLETEADLSLITSTQPESITVRTEDKAALINQAFTQTYQVRNRLRTPLENIKIQVSTPTHYSKREMVELVYAELQLNSGIHLECKKDATEAIETIGKASPTVLPLQIDCVNTPGVRCVEIKCPLFALSNPKESATVMIYQRFLGANVSSEFSLPDDFKKEGILIGSLGKIILDKQILDLIQPYDQDPDEVFSYTKFVDLAEEKSITNAALGGAIAGVIILLIIIFVALWLCGCFKRKTKEDFEAEANKKKHGFEEGHQQQTI